MKNKKLTTVKVYSEDRDALGKVGKKGESYADIFHNVIEKGINWEQIKQMAEQGKTIQDLLNLDKELRK